MSESSVARWWCGGMGRLLLWRLKKPRRSATYRHQATTQEFTYRSLPGGGVRRRGFVVRRRRPFSPSFSSSLPPSLPPSRRSRTHTLHAYPAHPCPAPRDGRSKTHPACVGCLISIFRSFRHDLLCGTYPYQVPVIATARLWAPFQAVLRLYQVLYLTLQKPLFGPVLRSSS